MWGMFIFAPRIIYGNHTTGSSRYRYNNGLCDFCFKEVFVRIVCHHLYLCVIFDPELSVLQFVWQEMWQEKMTDHFYHIRDGQPGLTSNQRMLNKCLLFRLAFYLLLWLVFFFWGGGAQLARKLPKHYRNSMRMEQDHIYLYNEIDLFLKWRKLKHSLFLTSLAFILLNSKICDNVRLINKIIRTILDMTSWKSKISAIWGTGYFF